MALTHITGTDDAAALADRLNGNSRIRPIVVVSTPAGSGTPWIDAEEIASQTGRLADVYVLPTGDPSWAFSDRLPEATQVYGGAGRVYPVGHKWASSPAASPLRCAFDSEDGRRATDGLVSDALRMAAEAGLLAVATPALRRERGTVSGIVAGRAMVQLGAPFPASIAEELTVPGVPIDRLLAKGQAVEGTYDPDTHRLDVSGQVRSAREALACYRVGDVVLTRVALVRNGKAELTLYPRTPTGPGVDVSVLRAAVTSNDLDDLRTLMTVGEIIPARILATEPGWALTLLDVDDDEPIKPAPSLLPGGPAWLVEGTPIPPKAVSSQPAPQQPVIQAGAPTPVPAPVEMVPPPAAAPEFRPSPALFGRTPLSAVTPVSPASPTTFEDQKASTRAHLLKIDALNARVATLKRRNEELQVELEGSQEATRHFRGEAQNIQYELAKAEDLLSNNRTLLRKTRTVKTATTPQRPVFADPERNFRYQVETQWALRTTAADQLAQPLPQFILGPDFLSSLAALDGVSDEKVADVAFEIICGHAPKLEGRAVHRLRTSMGADSSYVKRAEDGATAWRASLQINTPGARRIHYWMLPGGMVEFSRVCIHDDFEIR